MLELDKLQKDTRPQEDQRVADTLFAIEEPPISAKQPLLFTAAYVCGSALCIALLSA